jgi:hypothetical protein
MAKVRSQSLVIDASVARAAGPEVAVHPTAKHCRDFLLGVVEICHRLVFTPAIEAEWNDHQSGFARRWRRSMFAKKKIDRIEVPADETLRRKLEQAAAAEKAKNAMLKDVHLIEAARATGMRVVALDEVVRECFRKAAVSVPPLRKVCWVNPDRQTEAPLPWLQAGAPADDFRMLGHSGNQT